MPRIKRLVSQARLARFEPEERAGRALRAGAVAVVAVAAREGRRSGVLGRTASRLRPCRGLAGKVRVLPIEDVDGVEGCAAGEPVSAGEELLALLADLVHEGRMSTEKAYLIGAIRVADVSVQVLAERLGLKPNTLVQRLRRAEVELCRLVANSA